MTARTKRRGFELARALSLTPRRARVRREVATSTACRPARAEALSLSSRAESSIGEANLFPYRSTGAQVGQVSPTATEPGISSRAKT